MLTAARLLLLMPMQGGNGYEESTGRRGDGEEDEEKTPRLPVKFRLFRGCFNLFGVLGSSRAGCSGARAARRATSSPSRGPTSSSSSSSGRARTIAAISARRSAASRTTARTSRCAVALSLDDAAPLLRCRFVFDAVTEHDTGAARGPTRARTEPCTRTCRYCDHVSASLGNGLRAPPPRTLPNER
jgi:hypothetical protein